MHFRSTYCSSQVLTQHIHNKKKTGKAQRASMAQEKLQESKLTKAGGRKPTHGCNYPMVGWPSVILTPMGPSLNLTREDTSRPSLRSALSLSLSRGHETRHPRLSCLPLNSCGLGLHQESLPTAVAQLAQCSSSFRSLTHHTLAPAEAVK